MKKNLLIIGISMPMAGTEKALLSFLETINRADYHITLLLARREGALLASLPPDITLLPEMKEGALFLLSGKNAPRVLGGIMLRHPRTVGTVLGACLKYLFCPRTRNSTATRLFLSLMHRICPAFEEEYGREISYDLVLSFFGDRTMFYAQDKVIAPMAARGASPRHFTWLHFDYGHPPRDDAIYRPYFEKATRVISVASACTEALVRRFPDLESTLMTFENPLPARQIRALAARPCPLTLQAPFLLTIARIAPQKGIDRIPHILALLHESGLHMHWYILGTGERKQLNLLRAEAKKQGVSAYLHLLGTLENPYPILAQAAVFALPSRYEGRPITVEEAKVLGVPIVVSNYLSAKEQLSDGALGIITPMEDDAAFADALKTLLTSKQARATLSFDCATVRSEQVPMDRTTRLLNCE